MRNAVSQHHGNINVASEHRSRPWTTHHGSDCSAKLNALQLLSLDLTNHKHHSSGFPEVVHLRMVAGVELLETVPSDCLVVHCYGHCIQLPGTCSDFVRLHPTGKELELWLPRTKQVLGEGYPPALVYAGYKQHCYGRGLYGCAIDLSLEGAIGEKDTVGHSCCILA